MSLDTQLTIITAISGAMVGLDYLFSKKTKKAIANAFTTIKYQTHSLQKELEQGLGEVSKSKTKTIVITAVTFELICIASILAWALLHPQSRSVYFSLHEFLFTSLINFFALYVLFILVGILQINLSFSRLICVIILAWLLSVGTIVANVFGGLVLSLANGVDREIKYDAVLIVIDADAHLGRVSPLGQSQLFIVSRKSFDQGHDFRKIENKADAKLPRAQVCGQKITDLLNKIFEIRGTGIFLYDGTVDCQKVFEKGWDAYPFKVQLRKITYQVELELIHNSTRQTGFRNADFGIHAGILPTGTSDNDSPNMKKLFSVFHYVDLPPPVNELTTLDFIGNWYPRARFSIATAAFSLSLICLFLLMIFKKIFTSFPSRFTNRALSEHPFKLFAALVEVLGVSAILLFSLLA